MGTFSKFHRFREVGEPQNVINAEKFGAPACSLFSSTKILTIHHEMEITDSADNVLYTARSKFISIHDKTDVSDSAGRHVAHIERKFFTIHQRHYVTMADGTQFELSTELFHLIKDIINIEGLGWQIRGNILALNFELYDREGNIIAIISQKLISIHDKYCIDIYQKQYQDIVVAILVTLQHMIRDREEAASSSSSSNDN